MVQYIDISIMVMIAGKTQYNYNKPILNSLSFPFLFSNLIFDMNIRKQFYELPNFEKKKIISN